MGRLTEERPGWIDDEFWTAAREPDDEEITDVYLKLKAYEDTGLEPEAFQAAMQEFANHQMELTYYRDIGSVDQFRALKEAEQKRREGCEFCHDQQNLMYYKFNEYVICPHCGRNLKGESHDQKRNIV